MSDQAATVCDVIRCMHMERLTTGEHPVLVAERSDLVQRHAVPALIVE